MNEQSIDLAAALMEHWRRLALFGAIGVAVGLTYAQIAPNWYEATLTVVPSQRSQDVGTMGIPSRLQLGFDPLQSEVQRIQAVLASNSVADEVIDKFKLQDRYDSDNREQARSSLAAHCSSTSDRKSGVVSLTCEDRDPQLAKDVVEFFGDVGNRVFRRVSTSSAHEERRFLEEQVEKSHHDIDEASRKLREFQEQHKIVDLPEQSKATISAMAQLKGQLLSKQIELSYLTSFSARTEATVVQLQQQISILDSKLQQLEEAHQISTTTAGSASPAGSASFFPTAMNVPELRFELEQLMRDQKIQETVFSLMTQRFRDGEDR